MRLRNPAIFLMRMFSVRRKRNDRGTVLPPVAKFIKKLKDKRLKMLYQKAIDKIREDYTVEYLENKVIVVIMAGTRENFYDQLKQYRKKRG